MERVCTKCNNILPSNEFYKGAQWCIKCRKVYNIENKLKIQSYYQQKDTSDIQKRFYYKNREKFFEYKKNKRKSDPLFKLKDNIRKRIYSYLKGKNLGFNSVDYLGCNVDSYKEYLQLKFDSNMSWENYGEYWEIDHIIPLFSFDLSVESNIKQAFNYENTRPLSIQENRSRPKKLKIWI